MTKHVVLTRGQNKLGNEKRSALFKLGNHDERHVLVTSAQNKLGNEQRRARFKVDTEKNIFLNWAMRNAGHGSKLTRKISRLLASNA